MDRGDLGTWGLGLEPGPLACALAAAGIVSEGVPGPGVPGPDVPDGGVPGAVPGDVAPDRDRLIDLLRATWQRSRDRDGAPVPWRMDVLDRLAREPATLPAPLLLDAWRASDPPSWELRFELHPAGGKSPAWPVSVLTHPELNTAGIYVRVDEPAVDVTWGWPLRVGLLPGSETFRSQLEAGLAEEPWMRPLVRLVDATLPDADCDLLLLPWDPRTALRRLVSLESPPYADCAVLIGPRLPGDDRSYGLVSAVRSAVRTSGVAVVHAPAGERWGWFVSVVGELSHNAPLDVALQRNLPHGYPAPLLVAAGRLVEQGRLERHVRKMAADLTSAYYGDAVMMVEPGSASERVLDLPVGSVPLEQAGAAMMDRSDGGYMHETDMATAAAEVHEAMAGAAAEPSADDRFIQARVSDISDAERPVPRQRSLRGGAAHAVAIRIGPVDATWLSDADGPPVPVHELPPDQDEHQLTVVLADTSFEAPPGVARITLPRRGPSTTAHFEVGSVDATLNFTTRVWRITVLHGNRVLQTALLRAPVGGDADEGEGIDVAVEAVVRPSFGQLEGRSHFDAALIVNHANDGGAGVMGVANGSARSFRVSPDLTHAIESLDAHLGNVALNVGAFDDGLRGPDFQQLFWNLAHVGASLCQHIVHDAVGADGVGTGDRLHVLSALPDSRLPVEFIYDRDAPDPGAEFCPGAEKALAAGRCGGDDCLAADQHHTAICPFGFWGISKVIERHTHDPQLARAQVGADDFGFRSEPARPRDELHVLQGAIIGSNYRVEQAAGPALQQVCQDVTGSVDPIRSWQEWQQRISQDSPSMLVLVVHSEAAPDLPLPRIEIGTEDWVMSTGFRSAYLRPSKTSPKPLLVLLGCETGSPPMDFGGFIAAARTNGAAIVVAAGALIHSVHAVEVTAELVSALRSHIASSPGTTFGNVFRAVRRDLFARGRPMILTLNAYGDADWLLR